MSNPLRNFLTDDLYRTLERYNLLNHKAIRDFQIKRRYKELRESGFRAAAAIEVILEEYPYLQFDTVRKIIYSVKLPEEWKARSRA
jgi:hypothetical protein